MSLDRLSPPDIPVDFGFTEEHGLAREAARRFLAERCPIGHVRALAGDPVGFDPGLWKELAALGWLGLVTPEREGGLGLDHLHLALLLDEMGRVLLPSPFFACLLSSMVLEHGASDAQRARWVPAIARGELIATTALCEPDQGWDPAAAATRAEAVDGGFVLRGLKTHILFGKSAGLLLVPCRQDDGELAVFAVEAPAQGLTLSDEVGIDATRRMARLVLDGVRVDASARLEPERLSIARALGRAQVRAAGMLAAEMVGGSEALLGLLQKYAIERQQFGRPIGAFQAVKHPIVDVMTGVEQARSQALGAAAALDHDPAQAEVLCRMAKALAGDVYHFAANRGVQLHGGFGFTWDCDVHFYLKRAMWSQATLGDPSHHRAHLASLLLDGDLASAASEEPTGLSFSL